MCMHMGMHMCMHMFMCTCTYVYVHSFLIEINPNTVANSGSEAIDSMHFALKCDLFPDNKTFLVETSLNTKFNNN